AVAASRAEAAALAERDEKEKAADETKAANEKLQLAYDQRLADQYDWDIRGLPLIWESGNAVEARRLLERQPEKLRNFEWHYWDRKTHAELQSTKLAFDVPTPRPTAEWTFSGDGKRLALVQWPEGRGVEQEQGEPKEPETLLTVWDVATQKVVRTHRF